MDSRVFVLARDYGQFKDFVDSVKGKYSISNSTFTYVFDVSTLRGIRNDSKTTIVTLPDWDIVADTRIIEALQVQATNPNPLVPITGEDFIKGLNDENLRRT